MNNLGYISVDKLIDFANNHVNKTIDANDIARFPVADVQEVKHGYWIMDWDDLWTEDSQQICSVCHSRQPMTINDDDYCPKCGAKMDGKENEK